MDVASLFKGYLSKLQDTQEHDSLITDVKDLLAYVQPEITTAKNRPISPVEWNGNLSLPQNESKNGCIERRSVVEDGTIESHSEEANEFPSSPLGHQSPLGHWNQSSSGDGNRNIAPAGNRNIASHSAEGEDSLGIVDRNLDGKRAFTTPQLKIGESFNAWESSDTSISSTENFDSLEGNLSGRGRGLAAYSAGKGDGIVGREVQSWKLFLHSLREEQTRSEEVLEEEFRRREVKHLLLALTCNYIIITGCLEC